MCEFFFMGGYAPFVWPSYGIGIGGLIILAVASVWTLWAREKELQILNTLQEKTCNSTGTECPQKEGTIHET